MDRDDETRDCAASHGSAAPAAADAPPARHTALFNVDPGWLFIVAGLVLCVSGVLIPAQRDLHELETQREMLRERERLGNERLRAYAEFISDLDRDDTQPEVTRRLAASQLNVLPAGDVAVVMTATEHGALTEWIDARVGARRHLSSTGASFREPDPFPDTMLTRLATGPRRLWLLGGGVLAVFFGIMLAPGCPSLAKCRRTSAEEQVSPEEDLRPCIADSSSSFDEAPADDFSDEIEAMDDVEPDGEEGHEDDADFTDEPDRQEMHMLTLEPVELAESMDSIEMSDADREEFDCEVIVRPTADLRSAAD